MNKKLILIFGIFLFLINTRLVQNIHLCKNHICSIQTSFESKKDNCCKTDDKSCCSKEKDEKDCCKDIVIKQNFDDLFIEKLKYEFSLFTFASEIKQFNITKEYFCNIIKINAFEIQSHAPPLYKLYQQYIFYA